jgi:erythromycin esterase-like protein
VTERGFAAVAVEGAWPDAYRVDEYVRGMGSDRSAEQALSSFSDFPEWMWRNQEVRDLVRWLRDHNASRPPAERVGFYGLDVQDLFGPIDLVNRWLGTADPAAGGAVRHAVRVPRARTGRTTARTRPRPPAGARARRRRATR